MIRINPLLLSLLLLFAAGCSGKKEKRTATLENNTTICAETNTSEKNTSAETNMSSTKAPFCVTSTVLKNITGETLSVAVDAKHFIVTDEEQPVVLVNFFSTWCPPCRGQIPYFEDLQKKYGNKLFVTGLLVNDDANITVLKTFYEKYHVNYFVSNDPMNRDITEKVRKGLKLDVNFTLPLTVIYRKGEYFTHYEGPVPVEMLDHDIKTALERE